MLKRALYATLMASSLSLCGCSTLYLNAPPEFDGPIMLGSGNGTPNFVDERTHGYLFWGLVSLDPGVVQEILRAHTRKKLTNLRVYSRVDVLDTILTLVTLGIYSQDTVRVEGSAR